MDRSDLFAALALVVAGSAIAVLADSGGWSNTTVFLVGFAALLVIGTLSWHFDWSRVRRLRRR